VWIMIVPPAFFIVTFVLWSMTRYFGYVGCVFLAIFYLLVVINAARFFVMCTFTEPGVIPKIRSEKIDYN